LIKYKHFKLIYIFHEKQYLQTCESRTERPPLPLPLLVHRPQRPRKAAAAAAAAAVTSFHCCCQSSIKLSLVYFVPF